MNTKRIRLNTMRKVKEEVRKYFAEVTRMFDHEGQHITASTQRSEGNKVLKVIQNLIEKEKSK